MRWRAARHTATALVLGLGVLMTGAATLLVVRLDKRGLELQIEAASENRISAFRREVLSETARLVLLEEFLEISDQTGSNEIARFMKGLAQSVSSYTNYYWAPASGRIVGGGSSGILEDASELDNPEFMAAVGKAWKGDGVIVSQRYGTETKPYRVAVARRVRAASGQTGVVIAVFSVTDVLQRGIKNLGSFGLNVSVYDLSVDPKASLLSFHRSRRSPSTRIPAAGNPPPADAINRGRLIEIGDRRWLIHCDPIPELSNGVVFWPAVWVAIAGLTVAILTTLLFRRSESRTRAIETVVRQRTRDLAEARDTAIEASRLKSQFLANVSHELRTPLNGILGTNSLLLSSALSPDQLDSCRTIQTCSSALLALMEDLLDMSRIEAGALAIKEIDFSLRKVLSECSEIALLETRRKGLDWQVALSPAMPDALRGDPDRLRQVLWNLIGNAIKFTERGGVSLSAEVIEGDHWIVRFAVADTGPGIPLEAQKILFRRFAQVDGESTRRKGGIGLGLAISKLLLERMNGQIGFDSAPGAGSVFHFTLPFAPAIAPVEEPSHSAHPTPVGRLSVPLRVLLAEDNLVNQKVAVRLLEKLGCTVEVVGDGAAAVTAASERSHDLILMDIQMPIMDGYSATQAIREAEMGCRRNTIIAITANAMAEDRERCLNAGMDAHLSKPIDLLQLRAALEQYCCGSVNPEAASRAAPLPGAAATRDKI